jgi:hypothetical protein
MHEPYPTSAKTVEPERPPAPPSVQKAVKLMYAGAAVSAVSLIVSLIIPLANVASTKASIKKAHPTYTGSQVNQVFNLGIGLAIIFGVLGAGLWLWMARANNDGRNWARILSTVFFTIATVELLPALSSAGPLSLLFTLVLWVIGAAAVFFLWRGESTEFIRSRQVG